MYATFAQFQSHWGSKRTANLTDELDASSRQAVIERGLSAASGTINTAAVTGGYTIPISGAVLFPLSATIAQEIDDTLIEKCIVIASTWHLQVIDDTEKLKTAKAECNAWLKALADGGGLPKAPPPRTDSLLTWTSQTGASKKLIPINIQRARSANP